MIEIKNLSKSFGKKKILDNFSLSLNKGDRIAVISPSGSGKTTLLRIIAGLDKKYSGTCEVKGKVSYVFQENRLFPNSTALENILAVNPDKSTALKLIAAVELSGEEDALPQSLSGGMKRRIALARALAPDFDILLLDEPFTGIDGELKIKIANNIEKELSDKTVVLVTHSEEEIELLKCKRIDFV